MVGEGKSKSRQDELQNLLVQLESGRRQLDAMSRQSQLVESAIMELRSTTAALKSLKESKVGTEVLVPVGSDSFVRAELKDNEKVLVGVGAKVSIEKTMDEAVELFEARGEDLSKAMSKISENAVELNKRITELNQLAEQLAVEISSSTQR